MPMGRYYLNKKPVRDEDIATLVKDIYGQERADYIMYVKAHKDLEYLKVINALDMLSFNGVRWRRSSLSSCQTPNRWWKATGYSALQAEANNMSMSAGDSNSSLSNEINVTPMIDVLLVLLIIFMMIIPMSRKAIDTQFPDPTPQPASEANPDQIVLEVLPAGQYAVNKDPVDSAALFDRLKGIYEGRPEKIIFVKGDTTVTYSRVIWAMDQARGAGVKVIGIPPK